MTIMLYIFSPDVTAINNSYFGDGEGPYLVSNTRCGEHYSNKNLLSCSRVSIHDYTSECSPGHDAGVICKGMLLLLRQ